MIKIVVDTEEEVNRVRKILSNEACARALCPHNPPYSTDCDECIEKYLKDKVRLYKKETVEVPTPLVV